MLWIMLLTAILMLASQHSTVLSPDWTLLFIVGFFVAMTFVRFAVYISDDKFWGAD